MSQGWRPRRPRRTARRRRFSTSCSSSTGRRARLRARWSRSCARLGPEGLVEAGPPPRRDLHAAGDHVRDQRRRAAPLARTAVPARPRAAGAQRRGMARRSSAASRSASARSTTSSTTSTTRARSCARASCRGAWWPRCPHFARAVHGIRPPGGVYTHVAGCDLVRHSDGTWKVIEDNVRIPSGISYVLENRAAMARLVPSCSPPTGCAPSTTTRSCC